MTAATVSKQRSSSRVMDIAFCALSIALMAVSAWVTVPLGPVPFTLQVFVMVFALLVLTPKQALLSIGGYIVLGAIGVPVFSSFRGGVGVLAGSTGGFIWGFFLGALVAIGVMALMNKMGLPQKHKRLIVSIVGAVVFIVITYTLGWAQLMVVANMGPAAAFAAAIAPFIVIDACKIVAAIVVAEAVNVALGKIRG